MSVSPSAPIAGLRRFLAREDGALGVDWGFITVGGAAMGILAAGALITATERVSDVMRVEVGAPDPEAVILEELFAAPEPAEGEETCEHMHNGKLKVHPISHPHCDPNWTNPGNQGG